ncbi:DUF6228 family protein [Streptomyces sp. NBC_01334]|uniref:DUF6228 family protein n=1 Tax=Streptomyces sp. NBC_01334 TaxID=2903827 RepID=UPI002E12A7F6|nr:DUF6228 family protein [Streptomyces sp. NBC_01334]
MNFKVPTELADPEAPAERLKVLRKFDAETLLDLAPRDLQLPRLPRNPCRKPINPNHHPLPACVLRHVIHHWGGHVHLTWGIHDRPLFEEWHIKTTTVHAAGEEMGNLAAEILTFLTSVAT